MLHCIISKSPVKVIMLSKRMQAPEWEDYSKGSSQVIYRLNAIPVKTPMRFFFVVSFIHATHIYRVLNTCQAPARLWIEDVKLSKPRHVSVLMERTAQCKNQKLISTHMRVWLRTKGHDVLDRCTVPCKAALDKEGMIGGGSGRFLEATGEGR